MQIFGACAMSVTIRSYNLRPHQISLPYCHVRNQKLLLSDIEPTNKIFIARFRVAPVSEMPGLIVMPNQDCCLQLAASESEDGAFKISQFTFIPSVLFAASMVLDH